MTRTNNYNAQLQRIVQRYLASGGEWPVENTARTIAEWAYSQGQWQPKQSPVDQLAADLAKAMREETFTDPQGRPVRAKHAVRGKQGVLWDDIRTAPAEHMHTALQQRRRGIVGDCRQLKNDADSFNQNYNTGQQILLSLDFTEDVAELEAAEHREPPLAE